jgi:beta-mannosidase
VYVVSDKLQPFSATLHTRLLDFTGNVLLDRTKDVTIPQQSSAIYLTFEEGDLAAKGDPHRSFLVADLEVNGEKISRNLQFFEPPRDTELPLRPGIESTLAKNSDDYTITLKSSKLARDVYFSFGDLDVRPSDNYVDLLPGETLTVTLKSSSSLNQLNKELRIVSLVDAFK